MAVNTELAKQIFIQISLHPETHDQNIVTEGVAALPNGNLCGTTACVAGWACAYAGLLEERVGYSGQHYLVVPDEWGSDDWFSVARAELGITHDLAGALFYEDLPQDVAREAVRLLAVGKGMQTDAEDYLESKGYEL